MAAILNSLQMSYQTFRLQKRTDDVLRVLSAVKAELPRYQAALRPRPAADRDRGAKRSRASLPRAPTSWSASSKDIDALEGADQADEILGLTPAGLSTDQEDED